MTCASTVFVLLILISRVNIHIARGRTPQPLASLPHPPGNHPTSRLRRPHASSEFVSTSIFARLRIYLQALPVPVCPGASGETLLPDTVSGPHVGCDDRPSRQPIAKVFVSVIVHFAFVSRIKCLCTIPFSLCACFPC